MQKKYKIVQFANRVNSDEVALNEPTHLNLHCLQIELFCIFLHFKVVIFLPLYLFSSPVEKYRELLLSLDVSVGVGITL